MLKDRIKYFLRICKGYIFLQGKCVQKAKRIAVHGKLTVKKENGCINFGGG